MTNAPSAPTEIRRTLRSCRLSRPAGARAWRAAFGLLAILVGLPAASALAQTRQVPVESLIYDLKNPDPVRRREAATTIGQRKVQSATPDLVAAVHQRRRILTRARRVPSRAARAPYLVGTLTSTTFLIPPPRIAV